MLVCPGRLRNGGIIIRKLGKLNNCAGIECPPELEQPSLCCLWSVISLYGVSKRQELHLLISNDAQNWTVFHVSNIPM